jgi:hypothetical protein
MDTHSRRCSKNHHWESPDSRYSHHQRQHSKKACEEFEIIITPPASQKKNATKAQICLSSSISSNISLWAKNPSDFFLNADKTITDFEAPALSFFYRSLLHFEHRRNNDLIRSRFLKVLFSKMKHELGLQRLHSHSSEILANIILESPLVGHDQDDIKENIIQWSKEESKIDNLCRDIDDSSDDGYRYLGTLFCLPGDIRKE